MSRITEGTRGGATRRPPGSSTATSAAGGRPASQRGPADDRYRRGRRRTTAEPLAASWNPEPPEPELGPDFDDPEPPRGKRGVLRTYGWRIYAVPVLIVLTVLAFTNIHSGPSSGPAFAGISTPSDGSNDLSGDVGPIGHEIPPDQQPNIPTAVLPDGPAFTQTGSGDFHVVPGNTPVFGNPKKVYKYTVEVENGIDPASYEGDAAFARTVDNILQNKKSWAGTGEFGVQRIDGSNGDKPDFRLSLTTPDTDHRPDACAFDIQYEASCYRASFDRRVVINLARWVRGAVAFDGDIGLYRQYAINHEVGHFFGHQHEPCPAGGALAPVMMQQTFGVADDYVWQLNQVEAGPQKTVVPKDGKVCKPNAWPNPQGQ